MVRLIRLGFACVAAIACAWATSAGAASLLELNFWLSGPRYDAVVPECEHPAVLGKIMARFAEKERKFWQSDLQIVGFDRIHETAFRPWARGAPDSIPRRYCSGMALVSDARPRTIHYWIGEDTGWIGASWGVEWCVVGLDRNWAYNPGCRMARP
ncbi:MAG: hypothetical protein ACJ8DQ_20560 [Xanthobacteraceae bacterium]